MNDDTNIKDASSEFKTLVDSLLKELAILKDGKQVLNNPEYKGKPPTWRAQSNSPYYKKEYADELLPVLDELIAKPDKSKRYLTAQVGLKPSSIYLRINQGWLYIIHHLDPTGKYALLKSQTNTCKDREGVTIRYMKSRNESAVKTLGKPIDVEESKEKAVEKWRLDLIDFITNGKEGTGRKIENLNLSQEDMTWIKEELLYDLEDVFTLMCLEPNRVAIYRGKIKE